MLSVSPHFRANHPAFAAHRAPPPAAAAAAADAAAAYVLALSPEWAAQLKPTIERLRDECVESGLRAVVERAPDLEEHEYDGGTMVKHDGGMVHVWIRA